MAKYKTGGWFKQSIRHSNARKYGKAGGKYSSSQLFEKSMKEQEKNKEKIMFYLSQMSRGDKIDFLMRSGLFKQGVLQTKTDKELDEMTEAGLEATGFKLQKHFGYAQTGFKTFQLKDGYEIIAHWEKTRNGFRHIAILMKDGNEVDRAKATYQNRTWESYEYQTVINDLLDKTKILTEPEKKAFLQKGEMQAKKEADEMFGNIGAIASLGEIMTSSKKESNDWKERMIKAGLPSLDIPEDWNTLSEDEKEKRLNKVIAYMKEK
jgi:hypothetical protein